MEKCGGQNSCPSPWSRCLAFSSCLPSVPKWRSRRKLLELYANADSTCHMSITLEGPRKRKPVQAESLNGPRKQWTDNGPSKTRSPAATQIDVSDTENEVSEVKSGGAKDNSPRTSQQDGSNKWPKTVARAAAVNADDWITQNHPQWQIWDDGG